MIEEYVHSAADQPRTLDGHRVHLDSDAIKRLQTPTPEFASQEQFDFDELELQNTIRTIIVLAAQRVSSSNNIRSSDVEEVLKTYPCHLLWFC
jgi:hypothetical protein